MSAESALLTEIETDAASYQRIRDLPKVLNALPDNWQEAAATETIVLLLKGMLYRYRTLGVNSHWSYDVNRHIALASALKAEESTLAHLRNVKGLSRIFQAQVS